jgi:hypothetical protein
VFFWVVVVLMISLLMVVRELYEVVVRVVHLVLEEEVK